MRMNHIAAGAHLALDGERYRIWRTRLGTWVLVNRRTHSVHTCREKQLYELFAFGALSFEKEYEAPINREA